jgi:biotin transport system substrate-specific component
MREISSATAGRRAFVGAATAPGISSICVLVVGAAAAMALAAQLRIHLPGTPVPMTLQSLAVLLVGYVLPPIPAAIAMVLYLATGAAGAPVFASSAGLAGITGGYLLGLPFAAMVVSILRGPEAASLWRLIAAGLCGLSLLFVFGVGWASVQLGGVEAAARAGFLPFLPKAVGELGLSAAVAGILQRAGRPGRPRVGGFVT